MYQTEKINVRYKNLVREINDLERIVDENVGEPKILEMLNRLKRSIPGNLCLLYRSDRPWEYGTYKIEYYTVGNRRFMAEF